MPVGGGDVVALSPAVGPGVVLDDGVPAEPEVVPASGPHPASRAAPTRTPMTPRTTRRTRLPSLSRSDPTSRDPRVILLDATAVPLPNGEKTATAGADHPARLDPDDGTRRQ
ncbi:hypothetical protein GCM10022415_13380 [Knoellia locipacati]|uniref:Uncharacterized protein n=1 Tax=Knoellia locipacati TaxID=882824 RepID=A0A512SZ96_9MICO|nr:hypothetical protein KLO01_13350 [Knoellia locipacati]